MRIRLESAIAFTPPEPSIQVIDAHTEGEPLRVIVSGYPSPIGDTILERRRYLQAHHDGLRKAIMWEPRGHADMYGCLLTPPTTPEADFGVLFMHNEGYSTMCGHGIIAVSTVALETGMLAATTPETRLTIDTPAGQVMAWARMANGKVQSVRFQNVVSYAHVLDRTVDVPGLGSVRYDIAFGGAYYAYVDAEALGLTCTPAHYHRLIAAARLIKQSIVDDFVIVHPLESDLGFLYGIIFVGPGETPDAHSRNVCVFAESEVDRSPTGTGVSGRAALQVARGELALGERIRIESIVGSSFMVSAIRKTTLGPYPAIIPEVEGRAFITGCATFALDERDPFRNGFLLR